LIRFLRDITNEPVGGKAKGLKTLTEIGLKVPEAFVLIHPRSDRLDDTILKQHLNTLGPGLKAVRSSAVSEDGQKASFAGQFETFLNLRTYDEIKNAIVQCIDAAQAHRVKSYSGNLVTDADLRISVILQNMVEARVAGVVFSANPVTNRRDKMLINAIAGHGEALVNGMKDAFHYEFYRSESNIESQLESHSGLLTVNQVKEILEGAKRAEKHQGFPVDLEWAIDQKGTLLWLQVRPITTLQDVHYNELDSVKGESTDVWTLGNIGEMMPGVATPLTWSVSAEAIDYGMAVLANKAGAFPLKARTSPRYIQMFYNRLFINMTNMMDYPKNVWLNKADDVQFALSGKIFPGITAVPEAAFPRRVFNFFRQIDNTLRAQKYLEDLRILDSGFAIKLTSSMDEVYNQLETARKIIGIGFGHHLMTSAQSGTLYSTFMRIMTDNKRTPQSEDHHIATILLLDNPEIESADAVKSLERFAREIKHNTIFSDLFIAAPPAEALRLILEEAPPEILQQFNAFIKRHGHRCVRESELREKTWGEHPQQLIQMLQTRVRTGDIKHQTRNVPMAIREALSHVIFFKRLILRRLIPTARKGVARREISKGMVIHMVDKARKGYQHLAKQMLNNGLLDDVDQIYFLTHEEIGQLLRDHNPAWKEKANKRRVIFPELDKLTFEEISFGIPEPLEQEVKFEIHEGQLKGTPVSAGIIEGRVRIINTLEDAEKLQDREIMVASFTDVGWTPYFSIVSGLITEIGSPLSHGAVVAREYGIPAVVGAKGAKRFLSDGMLIRLDGNKGIIEKIG